MKKYELYREDYLYANGKAIVDTTENQKKEYPYNDVLEKRLSQENLVRKILNALVEWQDFHKVKKGRKKNIVAIILSIICMGIDIFLFMSPYTIVMILGSIGILVSSTAIILNIREIKKQNKQIKRKKVIIPYLKGKLQEETEKLEELINQEKILNEQEEKNQIEEISVRKIPNNCDVIGKINEDIDMYWEVDTNLKRFILYFELGILRQKLQEMKYSEEKMDKIEKYISLEATHNAENKTYSLTMNLIKNVRK